MKDIAMSISATSLSKLFTLADTDKNSALTATELADVADSLPNPSGSDAATLLKKMDTNGDGTLSATEFTDGVQLNEKVSNALLSAQELMSGNTLLAMLNGNNNDSSNSLFGSLTGGSSSSSETSLASLLGGTTSSNGSTDTYSTLLQNLLNQYANTTDTTTATNSTSSTEA